MKLTKFQNVKQISCLILTHYISPFIGKFNCRQKIQSKYLFKKCGEKLGRTHVPGYQVPEEHTKNSLVIHK